MGRKDKASSQSGERFNRNVRSSFSIRNDDELTLIESLSVRVDHDHLKIVYCRICRNLNVMVIAETVNWIYIRRTLIDVDVGISPSLIVPFSSTSITTSSGNAKPAFQLRRRLE